MSPSDPTLPTREETTAAIGLLVFLGSSVLLFLALIAAALLLRLHAPGRAPRVPWWWSLTSGSLLLGVVSGVAKAERPWSKRSALIGATLFLGTLVFLWRRPFLLGRFADPSSSGLFFTLTGVQAVYVAAGLFAWRPGASRPLWTLYWRVVGSLWIVTLASTYVP